MSRTFLYRAALVAAAAIGALTLAGCNQSAPPPPSDQGQVQPTGDNAQNDLFDRSDTSDDER